MFGSRRQKHIADERLHDLDSKLAAISRSQALIEFDLDGTILDANENLLRSARSTSPHVLQCTPHATHEAFP